MVVGSVVRRLREKKGLSQECLGLAVGLPKSQAQPTISRLETGDAEVPRETLKLIARELDAPEVCFAALCNSPLFHEGLALSGIDYFRPDPHLLLKKIKEGIASLEMELTDTSAPERAAAVADMCQVLTLLLAARSRGR